SRTLGVLGISGITLWVLWRMLRKGSEELLAVGVPVGQMLAGQTVMMAGATYAGVPAGASAAAQAGGGAPKEGAEEAEEEDDQEAQEKKKKMKMDFGLSKQRPERVTLEVLKDLIRDNPQKMVQAARAWLVNEPDKE
ncbi:MAG: hypothetical protein ACKOKG_06920, partial [Verrucomicrobiota bacterium]